MGSEREIGRENFYILFSTGCVILGKLLHLSEPADFTGTCMLISLFKFEDVDFLFSLP
jgi:hypothetical protein